MNATVLNDENCDPGECRANMSWEAKISQKTKAFTALIVMAEHYAENLEFIARELRNLAAEGRDSIRT
jgi:hypothetical protein